MDLQQRFRDIVCQNLDKLEIKEYRDCFQNQVMTLGIKILSEEVDEENRFYELNYLANAFKENFSKRLNTKNGAAWVIINGNTIYGYIALTISDYQAKLEGLYLDPLLRKLGFGGKLLKVAIKHCVDKKVGLIFADVAFYNQQAISFYTKNSFTRLGTKKENCDKLTIYAYLMDLRDYYLPDYCSNRKRI